MSAPTGQKMVPPTNAQILAKPILKPSIAPGPMPGKPTTIAPMPPQPQTQDTLAKYLMDSSQISFKGCIEAKSEMCTLLDKVCKSGMTMTQQEMMVCAQAGALCSTNQNMKDVDMAASMCFSKSMPLTQLPQAMCSSVPADQQQSCLAMFKM